MSSEFQPGTDSLGSATLPTRRSSTVVLRLTSTVSIDSPRNFQSSRPCLFSGRCELATHLDLAGESDTKSQQPRASRAGPCASPAGWPTGPTGCGCGSAPERGENHVRARAEVRRLDRDDPCISTSGPARRARGGVRSRSGCRARRRSCWFSAVASGESRPRPKWPDRACSAWPRRWRCRWPMPRPCRLGWRLPAALTAAVTGYLVVASTLGCLPAPGAVHASASRFSPSARASLGTASADPGRESRRAVSLSHPAARWACARPYRRSMCWCSGSSSAWPARAGRGW